MKKVLFLTLFMLVMILDINIVKAEACDETDMARLKGLAEGVSYSSRYIGNTSEGTSNQDYKVSFLGLTDEIYVSDSHYTFRVVKDGEEVKVRSGITDLQIYARQCYDLRLKTITIDLPVFNIYSISGKCQSDNNKELEVCDPWFQGKITDDEFEKIIEENDVEGNNGLNNDVVGWFDSNKIIVIVITFVLIVGVIVLVCLKNKNNSLD